VARHRLHATQHRGALSAERCADDRHPIVDELFSFSPPG
jgi:hypothetical protein